MLLLEKVSHPLNVARRHSSDSCIGHMMGPFLDGLARMPIEAAERVLGTSASAQHTVEKARLERALGDLDVAIQAHSGKLREQWLSVVSERTSSKRPAEDDESVLER